MSTRINLSHAFFATSALVIAACTTPIEKESFDSQHQNIGECDPDDETCKEPCPPDDAACQPAPGDVCAQQLIKGQGPCDAVLGYRWNGASCEEVSGCTCDGPDCDQIFSDPEDCKTKFEGCDQPTDDCSQLFQDLAALLPQIQACSLAGVPACDGCGAIVPGLNGCAVPANPNAPELVKYLETWETYKEHCPLPEIACQDPTGLAAGCVQSPDIDSLLGVCSWLDDATDPAAD